jgi:predicted LPLAT superfamily acyltransferase
LQDGKAGKNRKATSMDAQPRRARAAKAVGRWEGIAERGTLGALRLMARIYGLLGRRMARAILHPIAAYFFVREGASRNASRRYLERVWAHPDGRSQMRGRPGFFAPYWHYHEFAVQILDRMVLWGRGLSDLRMDHEGSEHLFALKRDRRGGILLGAHVGSFDIPRQLAGGYGIKLTAVMFTAHGERINRFIQELDPDSQVRVLSLAPGSTNTAFEIKACLDRGELVGMLADRLPVGGGDTPVVIDFLGLPMAFPLSPFRLACLLGVPVFISLCLRKGDAHYETVVRPVGSVARVARRDRDEAAVELARAWVQGVERACLEHPYQWFNFYDRWEQG